MTTKVTLRQKKISKGRLSLYLDFYPPITNPKTGKQSRRQFLKLYVKDKPKTPIERQDKKETLKIGESIRQKKENHLNKPEIYSEYEKKQLRIKELENRSFLEYFQKQADKKNGANKSSWLSTLSYLEEFAENDIKFKDLNETYLEEFKDFLLTVKSRRSSKKRLSRNTAVSYFNKVKAALRQAFNDNILQSNLNAKIRSIKPEETRREHLTIEELNKLVKTPCVVPVLKRAALFSALTGLRFSDIQKMKWKEVILVKDQGYYLHFNQKKTKGVEYLPIGDQAFSITEGKTDPREMPGEKLVFKGLVYSASQNKLLDDWIRDAGINKHITFHCFRHTYATLQLHEGTNLYTVSKMLGHKNIKTTQVYAKIVDEEKRSAANKIKLNF